MVRKGMGKGKGRGYQNMTRKDPTVHSQSSKGMKQPQRVNINLYRVPYGRPDTPIHLREYQLGAGQPVGTIKEYEDFFKGKNIKIANPNFTLKEKKEITKKSNLKDSDKDGVADIFDCDPNDPDKHIDPATISLIATGVGTLGSVGTEYLKGRRQKKDLQRQQEEIERQQEQMELDKLQQQRQLEAEKLELMKRQMLMRGQ